MEYEAWHDAVGAHKEPAEQTADDEGMGHLCRVEMYACEDEGGDYDNCKAAVKLKIEN